MRKSNAGIALVAVALLFSVVQGVQAGKLRRLIYSGYTGSWITNLYTTNVSGVVAFPNQPDAADFLPNPDPVWNIPLPPYNAQTVIHTGAPDNYGSWIEGYLTAPQTGQYIFWLASDDEGQFYMTTDPADPLNSSKTNLLCWVPGYSGSAQWDKFPQQQSVPVTLEQGKTYYIEIFHKDGTGGDHIEIGWQTPSGLLQRPMPAWYFQPIKFANPFTVEPDAEVILGQVTPNSLTPFNIYDGNMAIAYVNINLAMPVTYQWLKNGTPMAGETNGYYLFRANTSDNNTVYSVNVTSGGTVYSAAAQSLFVINDKPTVVSAGLAPQNPTLVQVVFSEEVNPQSATNTSNYTIAGATVQSATLAADGRTVSVKTTLLAPTQVYTVNISGVQDMATPPNTMDPASATFIVADGSINFRVYNNSFATDLASLRAATTNSTTPNAIYINNRFDSDRLITYMSPAWNLIPLRNYYVGQIIGYVTPPVTGQYKFAIASDDHSILYLGFTDQRSSKREICNYNGATGRWNLGQQYANQQSAPITLQAGQRYFIEAVYRDGTGGDGVTVCWQTPTDVANGTLMPTNNASTQSATEPFLIPARYLSPFTAFGNVFFRTDLPATLSAAGGTAPVLKVTVDGTLPYNYQWFRDGTAIAGATGSAYTLPYLQAADNAATFSVTVSNNFSSATSVTNTLTVTADTIKPTVASVGSLFKQTIEVRFSEPVAAASAGDKANYLLFSSVDVPVAVNGVVLDGSDATHVTLQTAAMPETDLVKLVVQNVTDLSANVINPATNQFRANNFEAAVSINNNQAWSATAVGEQLLLTSGGADIWGTADGCLFLYKTVSGNFDYKVQGVSLPAVNSWCKMGPMGRASTAAGSRNVFNPFTPVTPGQNTYSAQIRNATGGSSQSSNDAGSPLNSGVQPGVPARPTINPYPSWTRIQRINDIFYYYYSADGTNWTYWTYYDSSVSPEGVLPRDLLMGVALTSHDSSRTVDGVLNQFIAVNDGALRFALMPTNTTCVEGSSVSFTAVFAGGSPYSYQWLTNGTPVNATPTTSVGNTQTLTLTRVPYSLNGLQVLCRMTNPYGETVTSTNATLTVVQDTIAPTVRYYLMPKININPTEVRLLYSEPVNKVLAETLANYQITARPSGTPLVISSALLDTDERTVILTTAAQTPGTTYQVVVNNVTDQACCPPNAIAANSSDYFYYAGSSGKFAPRADGFIIMEAENAQRFTTGTSPVRDWMMSNNVAGFSGRGYMLVTNVGSTTGGTTVSAGVGQGTGAKMEYDIQFSGAASTYTVWIRGGNAPDGTGSGNNDSIFVGFDGNLVYLGPTPTTTPNVDYSQATGWNANYQWRSQRGTGTNPLTISNITAGVHTLVIWQREDGTLIDKIILEPGNRGSTTAPAVCNSNGGLGDPETWQWLAAPPGAPSITIVNPTNTQAFAAGASVPIEASVPAPPSPVALVEFFSGTNLLGTAATAPYTTTWASLPEGIYPITARVTDVLGYQATSAAVQFVVDSTKPVAYAVGSLGGTGIGVYFSDLTGLDPVSAANPTNYLVNGGAVNVTNATLEIDNLAVMLSLDAPISGSFSVQITNVADLGFGPNVMQPTTLSSTVVTWALHQDIGTTNTSGVFTDPAMPGFAQAIGTDGFYVRAGGHDIWDAADGLQFVYLPITGDFDVSTRVAALLQPDQWSKAGIMIREELTGDSRNHLIAATPTTGVNLVTMQWRPVKGSASVGIASNLRPTPSPIPNAWLRVTGTNNLYTFMWGTNGTDWTTLYTTNMSASPYSTVYVGLATTSHNNGTNLSNITAGYYLNVSGLAPVSMAAPTLSVQYQNSTLTLSWPADRIGMRLENQFHPPGGGIDNNWSTVPGSSTTNKVVIPIELNQGSMFFRLAYP